MIERLLHQFESRLSDWTSKKVVIQKGDTLWDLASAHGVDCERLAAFNNLTRKDLILAGDVLRIPPQAPRLPSPLGPSLFPRTPFVPSATKTTAETSLGSMGGSYVASSSSISSTSIDSSGIASSSIGSSSSNGTTSSSMGSSNGTSRSSCSSSSSSSSSNTAVSTGISSSGTAGSNSSRAGAGATIALSEATSAGAQVTSTGPGLLPASMSLSAPLALPHLFPSPDRPFSSTEAHTEASAPAGAGSAELAKSRPLPHLPPSLHRQTHTEVSALYPPASLDLLAASRAASLDQASASHTAGEPGALRQESGDTRGVTEKEGPVHGEWPNGQGTGWGTGELALPEGDRTPGFKPATVPSLATVAAPSTVASPGTASLSSPVSAPATMSSPAEVLLPARPGGLSLAGPDSLKIRPPFAAAATERTTEPATALATIPAILPASVPTTTQATAQAAALDTTTGGAGAPDSNPQPPTARSTLPSTAQATILSTPPFPAAMLDRMALQPAERPAGTEAASSTQARDPEAPAVGAAGVSSPAVLSGPSLARAPGLPLAAATAAAMEAPPSPLGTATAASKTEEAAATIAVAGAPTIAAAAAAAKAALTVATETAAEATASEREAKASMPEQGQLARGPSPSSVVISEGDCLWDIAEQYQVSLEDLLSANCHNARLQSDPMLLFPGDSLALPRHARRIPRALRGIRGATAVTRFLRPKHQGPAATTTLAHPDSQAGSDRDLAAAPVAANPVLGGKEGVPVVWQRPESGVEAREGRGESREEEEEEGYSLHLKDTYPGASSFFRVFPRAQELNIYRRRLRVLLDAMRYVETSFIMPAPSGDNGLSIGPLQISVEYHADAWWLAHPVADVAPAGMAEGYATPAYAWCHDVEYAERTVINYWLRYCPWALEFDDHETLARTHNGGPAFYRHFATNTYWRKVREAMRHSGWFKTYPELDPLLQASALAPHGNLPLLRFHLAFSPPFLDYTDAATQEDSTVT